MLESSTTFEIHQTTIVHDSKENGIVKLEKRTKTNLKGQERQLVAGAGVSRSRHV